MKLRAYRSLFTSNSLYDPQPLRPIVYEGAQRFKNRRVNRWQHLYIDPASIDLPDMDQRIDINRAIELHGERVSLLSLLTQPEKFKELFDKPENTKAHKGGLSRGFKRCLKRLLQHSMVVCVKPSEGTIYCPLFLVPKKSGRNRLIVDCRPINQRMKRPPKAEIPTVPQCIETILAAKYVSSYDAKSYFYQFPLHDEIARFFQSKLAGARGAMETVSFLTMPMGWTYAPAIAQQLSNAVIGDKGCAFVDNFFVIGSTLEQARERAEAFLKECKELNISLDNEEVDPQTKVDALGLTLDLESKTVKHSTEFINSLDNLAVSSTSRKFFTAMGQIIWHAIAYQQTLAHYDTLFTKLREIASDPSDWDDPIQIEQQTVQEVNQVLDDIRTNAAHTWIFPEPPSVHIWSDSSDDLAAAFLTELDFLTSGDIFQVEHEEHIFIKELRALHRGVQLAVAAGHRSAHAFVDNAPAVLAVARGLSSNSTANALIASIHLQIKLTIQWIPSEAQYADIYTRGHLLPHCPSQFPLQ